MLVGLGTKFARRYRRFLDHAAAFSHLKVILSFVTAVATIDTPFEVVWPASFARALDAMMVLAFDVGAILGAFCIVDISFFDTLLSSTPVHLGLVITIIIGYRAPGRSAQQSLVIGVYLLLFSRIQWLACELSRLLHVCHDIEDARYRRRRLQNPMRLSTMGSNGDLCWSMGVIVCCGAPGFHYV
jgi:hypothetical protein